MCFRPILSLSLSLSLSLIFTSNPISRFFFSRITQSPNYVIPSQFFTSFISILKISLYLFILFGFFAPLFYLYSTNIESVFCLDPPPFSLYMNEVLQCHFDTSYITF